MNKLLALALLPLAMLFCMPAATAADLPPLIVSPPPPPPPPLTAPGFAWDGIYVGAVVGVTGGPAVTGGAQAGFIWVLGDRFFAGVEGQVLMPGTDLRLSGRGGLARESLLLYGEIGAEFGPVLILVGGGGEYAFGDRFSVFVETHAAITPGVGFGGMRVQAGVNYHR